MVKSAALREKGWGPALSATGLVLGALFLTASLTPSLMPRDPVAQGALGGAAAVIGHEIGLWGGRFWRYLGLPGPRGRAAGRMVWVATAAALVIFAVGLVAAHGWQDETRRVVGLEPVEESHRLVIGGVALGVFAALWALFRSTGLLARRIGWWLQRVLPPRVAAGVGFALSVWLVWALIDGFLVQRMLAAADASFDARDSFVDPDVPPPADPMKTGSAASLVPWETMGNWGRDYVTRAPTLDELSEFHDGPVMEPIRVYVGRRSAETPRARAELALAELIRQGGFDREVLVVMTPVGTGWMDPGAHDTLDFMMAGDVATVSVQYSHLTSILSLLVHPEYGVQQAREVLNVVYEHWQDLPEDKRPRLYLHGLSQGALNSQLGLPLLDLLADPIDGAFWVGSPFMSPFWAEVRDNPRPGSLPWRPQFGNGSLIRTFDQTGGLNDALAPWGPIRLVMLNYPSDAIVHFTFDSALQRPVWLGAERPADISPDLRWFPVVTMLQMGLDMALSLQVPRFGHYYTYPDYIEGWAALVEPEGWSEERSATLRAIFAERPPAF